MNDYKLNGAVKATPAKSKKTEEYSSNIAYIPIVIREI